MDSATNYEVARIGPRAPRAAIVIDGDNNWEFWVHQSILLASRVWGGAGFVIVPHHAGQIDPSLLRLVTFYDPDYVVTLQKTISLLEEACPGQQVVGFEGRELRGEELLSFLKEFPLVGQGFANSTFDERARENVRDSCSSYRRRLGKDTPTWNEPTTYVDPNEISAPFVSLSATHPTPSERAQLGVPAGWTNHVALTAAAHLGIRQGSTSSKTPPLSSTEEQSLLGFVIETNSTARSVYVPPNQVAHFPGAETSVDRRTFEWSFHKTLVGLTWISRREPSHLFVIGREVDDYCAAFIWDRTFGRGIWVSDQWVAEENELWPTLHMSIRRAATEHSRRGQKSYIASTSQSRDQLAAIVERFDREIDFDLIGSVSELPTGFQKHLACSEFVSYTASLPVHRDEIGSIELMTPPPLLIPSGFDRSPDPCWEIDVEVTPGLMPTGRALPGQCLLSGGQMTWDWIRSGRDGISHHSRSMGFVNLQAPIHSRTSNHRFRVLGLQAWVAALCEAQDYQVRLSPAGRCADVLARIWGDRDTLLEDISSPLLSAFRAFNVESRRDIDAYPNGQGVVISGDGYLTYEGFLSKATQAATDQVDRLLASGALRRGLIIRCGLCGTREFFRIDHLSQETRCTRCDNPNQLVHGNWIGDGKEPTWYYDLHPKMRELLKDDGEVPLLAAAQLKRKIEPSERFTDCPELEFFHSGNSRPSAEVDIIAHAGNQVVVGEAKCNGTLGNKKERSKTIGKLLSAAALLAADQILLATTHNEWNRASILELLDRIANNWNSSRARPSLRIMTHLESNPHDEIIDNDWASSAM